MVSLGDESRRAGTFFESQDGVSGNDSEELLARTGIDDDKSYRPIKTIPTICCVILLTVLLEVVTFLVPELCHGKCSEPTGYSTVLYTHAVVWFLVMLCDRVLHREHYFSRGYGYLEFYRQTRHIRRMPFVIYSGGNALLLALVVLLQDYCSNISTTCSGLHLHPVNFIQILISVEVLVLIPVITIYLVRTVRFNHQKAPPDVYQDDLLAVYTRGHVGNPDVGFKDEDFHEDIMEKQADLIRYLKQNNMNLARRILSLSEELRQFRKA